MGCHGAWGGAHFTNGALFLGTGFTALAERCHQLFLGAGYKTTSKHKAGFQILERKVFYNP